MITAKQEICLKGLAISKGVAIGTVHHLQANQKFSVSEFPIVAGQVEQEIQRYRKAIYASQAELEKLLYYLQLEGSDEAMSIIIAHIQMLQDPIVTTKVEETVLQKLRNVESIFVSVLDEYMQFFSGLDDPEVHQRLLDIKDVSDRILKHLDPESECSQSTIPSHSVVVAYELIPSYTAEASPNQVRAYVTQIGGPTSHAALIAKSKGIPYVSNVAMSTILQEESRHILVDGNKGLVILNPTKETLLEYENAKQHRTIHFINPNETVPESVETKDGVSIDVQANLEGLHDMHLLKEYKVKSIGLLRSEFLSTKRSLEEFTENEQFEVYKKLLCLASGIEVTFRVFDVGSDKVFSIAQQREPNPALGCRSIRFLLEHPQIFCTQLRATLRAASYGKLKILLPLVTDIEELREAKKLIQREKESLIAQGFVIPLSIPIGCMVEVPAFVMMSDQFAKECDFFSIGTNDLFQHTLAADRCNPKMIHRYDSAHPSILRMIKHVVEEANKANIPVNICGEMAANPDNVQLLISLGIRSLSCPLRFIPEIKRAVQNSISL